MKHSVFYYLAIVARRLRLRNTDFSILSDTCIGGVISSSLHLPFRSPTVNLIIPPLFFPIFCQHLREYSLCEVEKPTAEENALLFSAFSYPCGMLRGNGALPDIPLQFVHYSSFEEAREKWHERFARVNYENLFVVFNRCVYCSPEELDALEKVPIGHKVIFSERQDPSRWPDIFRFEYTDPRKGRTGQLYASVRKGLLEYRALDEFDYVAWLNRGVIQRDRFFARLNQRMNAHD